MALENMKKTSQALRGNDRQNFIRNFANPERTTFCTLEEAKHYRKDKYPKYYFGGLTRDWKYPSASPVNPQVVKDFVRKSCEDSCLEHNPSDDVKKQFVKILTEKLRSKDIVNVDGKAVKEVIEKSVNSYLKEKSITKKKPKRQSLVA